MFYLLLFFVVAFVVAIVFLSIIAFVLRLVGFLDLLLTCAHKCPVGMTNVALRICMYVLVESQLLISNLRSSQEDFTGGTLNKLTQVSACLPPPPPPPNFGAAENDHSVFQEPSVMHDIEPDGPGESCFALPAAVRTPSPPLCPREAFDPTPRARAWCGFSGAGSRTRAPGRTCIPGRNQKRARFGDLLI